jgi:hypothetical protein
MELTDAHKQTIRQWAAQGASLSELQRKLSELGLNMTYMEVRLLALDLGLQIKEAPRKSTNVKAAPASPAPVDEDYASDAEGGASSVSVEVDRIMKPGSIVSGTVKFSDGVSGTWMLDQAGRLGLSTSKPGYKPGGADLQTFQEELRRVLERQGI